MTGAQGVTAGGSSFGEYAIHPVELLISVMGPDVTVMKLSSRFLQGLSVAETAEAMERNAGAVKALQHRALRRLADLLPRGVR